MCAALAGRRKRSSTYSIVLHIVVRTWSRATAAGRTASVATPDLAATLGNTMHRSRSARPKGSQRSVRSALEDAADEVQRRRRLVRRALVGVGGALMALAALLLGGPR